MMGMVRVWKQVVVLYENEGLPEKSVMQHFRVEREFRAMAPKRYFTSNSHRETL